MGLGGSEIKYSIYSESWDGLSRVKAALESEGGNATQKYNISSGMSSLNILNRFYEPAVVTVIAPSVDYTFSEFVSVIAFLARGGSLIVVDDFGTGNQIFDPIFNALENWDNVASASNLPSLSELFFPDGILSGTNDTSMEEVLMKAVIFQLIGVLKRIGFNGTVLMDAQSNTDGSSAQPLIVDMNRDHPLTTGINKIQMELGTCISLKVNKSEFLDNDGSNTVVNYKVDWVPLITPNLLLTVEMAGEKETIEISGDIIVRNFIPFFSSKNSWMESNHRQAEKGEAQPDLNEWGNVAFAPAFTLPIGRGKIIMIGDPDIFINKWVKQTDANDNLKFILNLFDYASEGMNVNGSIPIIFDEGHAQQKVYSASVYSMTLMRFLTEMSMYPLFAPFIPIFMATLAYPLIPKKTRLSPVLWTKHRGEKGVSKFERDMRRIIESGEYSEAVHLYYRALVREVTKRTKSSPSPKDIAEFFVEIDPSEKSRALQSKISRIEQYLKTPKILREEEFMDYMTFIKSLLDKLPKYKGQ